MKKAPIIIGICIVIVCTTLTFTLILYEIRKAEARGFGKGEAAADLALKDQREKDAEKIERLNTLWEATFGEPLGESVLMSTTVEASSYNPVESQCDKDPLIAAWGDMVKPGIIAVPQAYRLKVGWARGQVILAEGLGPLIVMDHMSEEFGDTPMIDIISFIPEWSTKWGRRPIRVWWVSK